ncbi:class I SAM-dependent methyltransferase [Limisalsivibrio acetivorans]|uniref:class I SAM-dependent methyltransferase n=1 Tax=Limisalsivibrio acetivorans TaxID=1304888 RepID=UPI0003B66540|nr:class I SAM-dependent methyltransferase [Limisalsivibrio acetivorans]
MGFNESAFSYYISGDHIKGDDLDIIRRRYEGIEFENMLDVATGAGHCAAAVSASMRVCCDISEQMLRTAGEKNSHGNLVLTPAEKLPFKDNSFDVATCRLALHHFQSPVDFFSEVARVLRPCGQFVLIDSVVDVEDACLNVIEYIRDNSHRRSYRVEEILSFGAEKLRLLYFTSIFKRHDFYEWAGRLGADSDGIKRIEEAFERLPENIQKELRIERKSGGISAYTDKKGIYIFQKI